MSMCAERPGRLKSILLGLGWLLGSAQAWSGTVVDQEQKSLGAGLPDSSMAQRLPRATGPTLRCWQHGRLVVEETGIGLPSPERMPKALVFQRQDGGRDRIYVFDLNQGMCTMTETLPPAEAGK